MRNRNEAQVPRFTRGAWESGEIVTRIGDGGIGGKASGLWQLKEDLLGKFDPLEFPGIRVTVPRMVVLGTEVFDSFMELNDLRDLALSGASDERIAHAFLKASLPAQFLGDLRDFTDQVTAPLAIRSSSLLEDALEHPFAGVYCTKMIPNNQIDADERFRVLSHAIRFVYASTYFRCARDYFTGVGIDHGTEKMSVVMQEVVGARRQDRFYPILSGVARSFNYYPTGASKPTDGIVNLALGLGRQIVDGGTCWIYSPAYPAAPPPFKDVGDRIRSTQNRFWAVNMGTPPPPDPMRETEFLIQVELTEAAADGVLDHLVSTFDPRSDRLRMGCGSGGPLVLDFAPLLVGETLPLNSLLQRLFPLAERTAGCPVELEFAMDRQPDQNGDFELSLLQMRPMAVSSGDTRISPIELHDDGVVVSAEKAMGNGVRDDLVDIVYLKPEAFQAGRTVQIADEVDRFNRELVKAGSPYLLIGFGRWGSSDPWLGVPVDWGQISGAKAIVEASIQGMNPDPSQGSHFFHNLVGLGVFYLTAGGEGNVDWRWLEGLEIVRETEFVRHVRSESPLEVKVDGLAGLGLVQRSPE